MSNFIVIHEQTREYACPLDRDRLALRLRVERGFPAAVVLAYWNRCKKEETGVLLSIMKCYARDNMFDYYETIITTRGATRYIQYYFRFDMRDRTFWVNYYGICLSLPENGWFEYMYTNERDIFEVPGWLKASVFYQIFPERFYNGDRGNDPENALEWGGKPERDNFFGGDLTGIELKLEYLEGLGINAIYLNPVFEAPSNHKYDTTDYFKIDPHFGGPGALKSLVERCHEKGIRVVLDGVFNHCGYFSKQFQDVLERGGESEYRDWFYIEGFPVDPDKLNYETIGYYNRMPKLRMANPEVRSFILKIAGYWIREADIDGWRLDVADEVDYTFWQEFRSAVKYIKPDCFLLGETWKENRDMLRGDQMDSVMNYVFRDAVADFFAKAAIGSLEFDSRLNRVSGVHTGTVHNCMFNLLDSHDTARFLTLCNGNIERMKAAAAFQFCFPGVPVIYYGDEIGMEGENDPGCRKPMEWRQDRQSRELLEWYGKIIGIRKSKAALRDGSFSTNYCSGSNRVYGFFREAGGERVYFLVNNSDISAVVKLPVMEYSGKGALKDLISGSSFEVITFDDDDNYYNDDINKYRGIININLNPYQVCILS